MVDEVATNKDYTRKNLKDRFFFVSIQPNGCCTADENIPIRIDAYIDDMFRGLHKKYTKLPCPVCGVVGLFKTGMWHGNYITLDEASELKDWNDAKDYTLFELQASLEENEREIGVCRSKIMNLDDVNDRISRTIQELKNANESIP